MVFLKNAHFILFIALIASCSEQEQKQKSGKLYFDFPAIVQKQKTILEKNNLKIIKKTYINKSISIDTLSITDWKKEFAIFENIDLNKTSFRDKIISKPIYQDTGFINYYFKKKEAKIDFKHLISYTTKSNKIKHILIDLDEKTLIYNSRKKVVFKFDTTKNELKSYQFSGAKGFLFMPKDSFYVESTILNGN